MKKKKSLPAIIYMTVLLLLIYLPIFVLMVYSFTTSTTIGAIRGFSFANYETLVQNEELFHMIIGTLLLAVGSAAIATVLGTLGALGGFYSKPLSGSILSALNEIPVVNADVVTGFSICIALVVVCGMDKSTFVPLVIGHVVLSAPFVYLSVTPKLKQLDPSLYEAAMDLGATPAQALCKVVLPQILSGILSGFAMALTLSLDDYFIASYTKPATFDTISTYVVNATKGSQTEIKTALWALSTVIFLVVVLIVVLMNTAGRKKEKTKLLALVLFFGICGAEVFTPDEAFASEKEIVLRVCNWEEYIDLGDWDEDEVIELDNGVRVYGENPMYEDFEEWYYEQTGVRVRVEYSCAGTNEDLYNQLTLGDTYDLVCPSDYMLMKLIAEGMAEPFSEAFFDEADENNYYVRGVSPYIAQVFEENKIAEESWSRYAACYMWGTTGVLYNPAMMSEAEASTWAVFDNPKFARRLTLKDNVRDTYFAALGYLRADTLTSEAFLQADDYNKRLTELMNDVTPETIHEVEKKLQHIMGNIYALETDSGKADMITGKIAGSYQWSGDAVYAMDQAEEDGVSLAYAVPRECSNLWFDGWILLKKGIGEDAEKKAAAEAFVNFLSRPDNVVRNMYYIGYTSAIAGGEDDTIFSYLNWCYGSQDASDAISYPLGYFFGGSDEDYTVYTTSEQVGRQLYTQYPSQEVISRMAIMSYFDETETKNINQMWINSRCFSVEKVQVSVWIAVAVVIIGILVALLYHRRSRMWYEP